eukprot:333076-Prymnesium_polylepis.1
MGFDRELDVEPDDEVPTLVLELKSTSALKSHGRHMQNPNLEFGGIDYANERATLVLMLYIPEDVTEATTETLKQLKFWYKHAFNWRPKSGVYVPTLYGGNDASNRPIPGRLLGEKLVHELERMARANGLIR